VGGGERRVRPDPNPFPTRLFSDNKWLVLISQMSTSQKNVTHLGLIAYNF
jgi:hypothetical protein